MRRKTQEEFEAEVAQLNSNVIILSKYRNWNTYIQCECKTCGNKWATSPSSLLQGCGCKKCGLIRSGLARKMPHEKFVEKLSKAQPMIKMIGTYNSAHTQSEFECLICGCVWKAEPTKVVNGHTGCPACGNRKRGRSNALSQDEFIERVKVNSPNIEILGKYVNNQQPIKMRCKKHDEVFYGNPRCIMYKGGNVCPKCNDSTGEKELHKILDEYGVNYEVQHSIDGCVHIYKLKFDAFDLDRNIGYEYQGQQHYEPVNFGNVSDDVAKENLKITQARDSSKRKYCKEHKIPLIEIPYWEKDNMRDFLIGKWKELNIDIA